MAEVGGQESTATTGRIEKYCFVFKLELVICYKMFHQS